MTGTITITGIDGRLGNIRPPQIEAAYEQQAKAAMWRQRLQNEGVRFLDAGVEGLSGGPAAGTKALVKDAYIIKQKFECN
jgi:hypothetical protein